MFWVFAPDDTTVPLPHFARLVEFTESLQFSRIRLTREIRLSSLVPLPATGTDRTLRTAADVIKMAASHVTLYDDVIKWRKLIVQSAETLVAGYCIYTQIYWVALY